MASVFVPRERGDGETRVAATPETVARLTKAGCAVQVEAGAGEHAGIPDAEYEASGATIVGAASGWSAADVVCKVGPPRSDRDVDEAGQMKPGAVLVCLLAPHRNPDAVRTLAAGKVTALAMELVPRISRAQRMDALSSQASIAGYRAVVLAAGMLDKHFPLLMTAAGTIRPAQVVVLGAGVAGLQAIATARRLGAVVHVSDVREAARAESESLGAKFIDVPEVGDAEDEGGYAREVGEDFLTRQRKAVGERLATADAAITTAAIPGRRAPLLITEEMVAGMPPGSIVVDLAAADGGNCALSPASGEVEAHGVRIVAGTHLPATMPREASQLYARNVTAFLEEFLVDGAVKIDPEHDVVGPTIVTLDGAVVHPATKEKLAEEVKTTVVLDEATEALSEGGTR